MGLVGVFLRTTEGKKGRVSFDVNLFPSLTYHVQHKLHHFKREADARARLNSSEQGKGTAASPGSGDGFK